jgi:hypothetical protein
MEQCIWNTDQITQKYSKFSKKPLQIVQANMLRSPSGTLEQESNYAVFLVTLSV